MKALVTGVRGFVGSHIDRIVRNTCEVTYCMTDPDIEVIFSVASGADVTSSIDKPRRFIRNNVDLVMDLLESAREMKKLKHFIHLSTSEVYGPCSGLEDKLEWSPIVPHSPYAASKAAQEAILTAYWKCYNVPVTIVNTMNVFGERQQQNKFIPILVRKILTYEQVVIHDLRRRFIHADCVADALLFIANRDYHSEILRPQRFHVAGETEVSLLDLAKNVSCILGKTLRHIPGIPNRPGHAGRYSISSEKIRALGWKQPMSFQESLERTIRALSL